MPKSRKNPKPRTAQDALDGWDPVTEQVHAFAKFMARSIKAAVKSTPGDTGKQKEEKMRELLTSGVMLREAEDMRTLLAQSVPLSGPGAGGTFIERTGVATRKSPSQEYTDSKGNTISGYVISRPLHQIQTRPGLEAWLEQHSKEYLLVPYNGKYSSNILSSESEHKKYEVVPKFKISPQLKPCETAQGEFKVVDPVSELLKVLAEMVGSIGQGVTPDAGQFARDTLPDLPEKINKIAEAAHIPELVKKKFVEIMREGSDREAIRKLGADYRVLKLGADYRVLDLSFSVGTEPAVTCEEEPFTKGGDLYAGVQISKCKDIVNDLMAQVLGSYETPQESAIKYKP